MKLQSLWTFLSVLDIFSDCQMLLKNSPSFRMILNDVTKLVDLQECPKDYPLLVKNSTSFKMILYEVTKLVDLQECPKYFFRLPTTCKKFYKLQNDFK